MRSVRDSPAKVSALSLSLPDFRWGGDEWCTFLLLGSGRHDDDVALSGFFVSSSTYRRARAAVESGIAEVAYVCVSDLLLGVNE